MLTKNEIQILELISADNYSFAEIADSILPIPTAQEVIGRLYAHGLVGVPRVVEAAPGVVPDRPVSSITPEVRSTSRITVIALSEVETVDAIGDDANWKAKNSGEHTWFEVTSTENTWAAYLRGSGMSPRRAS
jgi:hypothetical protein